METLKLSSGSRWMPYWKSILVKIFSKTTKSRYRNRVLLAISYLCQSLIPFILNWLLLMLPIINLLQPNILRPVFLVLSSFPARLLLFLCRTNAQVGVTGPIWELASTTSFYPTYRVQYLLTVVCLFMHGWLLSRRAIPSVEIKKDGWLRFITFPKGTRCTSLHLLEKRALFQLLHYQLKHLTLRVENEFEKLKKWILQKTLPYLKFVRNDQDF